MDAQPDEFSQKGPAIYIYPIYILDLFKTGEFRKLPPEHKIFFNSALLVKI
jgi:hypothetical protein